MKAISAERNDETGKLSTVMDRWFAKLFHKLLTKISFGQITIVDGSNTSIFGVPEKLGATIYVHDRKFYRKTLVGGSIGAGEAYVKGYWSSDDLTQLIRIMALNMAAINRIEHNLSWLLQPINIIKHRLNRNSRSGSKNNILSHYDLGNEMYTSFLDEKMMYSSAIYPNPNANITEAAEHKLSVICEKLDLKPTDNLIEIGSGWAGFALYAAKKYGCRITTTTISDAQFAEAKKRIKEQNLQDRITLLNKDYRELEGKYDKLVSIEMIEAVGHKFLPAFFQKCSELLKDDGKMLLQAITIRDQEYKHYINSVDFIQKHIFPGGCLPSNSRMLEIIAKNTDLTVRKIEDFGFDYAKTLNEWRRRFNDSFDQIKHLGFDDSFKRLWNYYFCYCEGGFLERTVSVVHLLATKPLNRDVA